MTTWIERVITPELKRIFSSFPVLVLVGPRQVGKSSLTERAFSDLPYVALDAGNNAEFAETRPVEFLERFAPPVLFDEIQYAPAIFRHIKAAVDARRGQNGLFVLTGSQNFTLMSSVSDSLAGRAAVIPLLGLSSREWSGSSASTGRNWRDFAWRGGYPALWADAEEAPDRDRWYQGYVATYLERDVRNLLRVASLRDFERFLKACAARTAQSLNLSDLGRDVGISPTTAGNWLSVLQTSGQVLLLEPYHRSLGKRLIKAPKLYFSDTGLAAFLAGFASSSALWQSHYSGAFFENFVVSQWLRWRDWQEPSANLWYWRDQSNNEVDLVVERNGKLHAIEVKLTERPDGGDLRGLKAFRSTYAEEVGQAFVACSVESPVELAGGVEARPGWLTWDLP